MPLPKSTQIKRSHYAKDSDYLAAMCRQQSHDTERSFLNRCARAEKYAKRKEQRRIVRMKRRVAAAISYPLADTKSLRVVPAE